MKKKTAFILLTLALLLCVGLFSALTFADDDRYLEINETNFPDANFRNWIIFQSYCVSGDEASGYYMTEERVKAVTRIDVSYGGIRSLTGIEHFTALESLTCDKNQLTALDVSKNTALESLTCDNNQLTALDVSKNTALQVLRCNNNKLTSLDVSQDTALTYLSCYNNALTALDVSKNTALTYLS